MINARDVHELEDERLPEEDEEVDAENDDLESEEDDEEELELIQVLPDRRLDTCKELPNLGFGCNCVVIHAPSIDPSGLPFSSPRCVRSS